MQTLSDTKCQRLICNKESELNGISGLKMETYADLVHMCTDYQDLVSTNYTYFLKYISKCRDTLVWCCLCLWQSQTSYNNMVRLLEVQYHKIIDPVTRKPVWKKKI